MLTKISCLSAALIVLTACSGPSGDGATSVTSVAAPAAAPSVPAQPAAVLPRADVSFTSSPASVRRCETQDGNATVALAWDATKTDAQFVTVKVADKVFAEGTSSGSTSTGPWVRDDTIFSLVNAADGSVLATLKIPFVDC